MSDYPYHTTWTRQDNIGLNNFWEEWWGPTSSGKKKLDRAKAQQEDNDRKIHIPQREVWHALNLLTNSNGWLLLRKEYQTMYDRLCLAYTSTFLPVFGIVLTGQPGIGKSYFNVLVLLEQMTEGRTVLFLSSRDVAYIFDAEGVWELGQAPAQLRGLDLPRRMWALIDDSQSREAVSPRIANSQFFVVYTTSPHETRFKGYVKQQIHVPKWIMQPWSDMEVLALLLDKEMSQMPQQIISEHATKEGAKKLIRDVGPCPRDIIMFLCNPGEHELQIANAVEAHRQGVALAQLFRDPFRAGNPTSYSLVLVRRDSVPNEVQVSDQYTIEFKNARICSQVLERLEFEKYYEGLQLYKACAASGPYGAVMSGWLFENMAVKHMSGNLNPQLSGFATIIPMWCMPMESAATRSKKFPHCFIHKAGSNPITLTVDTDSCINAQTPDRSQNIPQQPPISFPAKQRQIKKYNIMETIVISNDYFYRPTHFNFPGFDCFFFDISAEKVDIWALQMTVRKVHDSKSGGFNLVRLLWAAVVNQYQDRAVNVKYVLVVPQSSYQGVQWDMAPDYEEVGLKGDVYVQYFDMSRISCDVKLVIDYAKGKGDEI